MRRVKFILPKRKSSSDMSLECLLKKDRTAAASAIVLVIVTFLIIGLGMVLVSLYSIGELPLGGSSSTSSTNFTSTTSNTGTTGGSVTVSCTPDPVLVGSLAKCTAILSGYTSTGTGTIFWTTNQTGDFYPSNCGAATGGCSVSYNALSVGTAKINATFVGIEHNPEGYGVYDLNVSQRSSLTFLSCSSIASLGSPSKCTASVVGFSTPGGNVSFTASGSGLFNQTSCTLVSGSCFVIYTPSSTSLTPQNITAFYSGDANDKPSISIPYLLRVGAVSSTTELVCSPGSITIGSSSTCQVTVTGRNPTGEVDFSSTGSGATFSPSSTCTLSSGSCTVTFTPSSVSSVTIGASYLGDVNNSASSSATTLNVVLASSSVRVSCSPGSIASGSATECTANVQGYNPTGIVSWILPASGHFSPKSCTLSAGSCSVSYATSPQGSTVALPGAYQGDSNNGPSTGSFSLIVYTTTTTTTTSSTLSSTSSTTTSSTRSTTTTSSSSSTTTSSSSSTTSSTSSSSTSSTTSSSSS